MELYFDTVSVSRRRRWCELGGRRAIRVLSARTARECGVCRSSGDATTRSMSRRPATTVEQRRHRPAATAESVSDRRSVQRRPRQKADSQRLQDVKQQHRLPRRVGNARAEPDRQERVELVEVEREPVRRTGARRTRPSRGCVSTGRAGSFEPGRWPAARATAG